MERSPAEIVLGRIAMYANTPRPDSWMRSESMDFLPEEAALSAAQGFSQEGDYLQVAAIVDERPFTLQEKGGMVLAALTVAHTRVEGATDIKSINRRVQIENDMKTLSAAISQLPVTPPIGAGE